MSVMKGKKRTTVGKNSEERKLPNGVVGYFVVVLRQSPEDHMRRER